MLSKWVSEVFVLIYVSEPKPERVNRTGLEETEAPYCWAYTYCCCCCCNCLLVVVPLFPIRDPHSEHVCFLKLNTKEELIRWIVTRHDEQDNTDKEKVGDEDQDRNTNDSQDPMANPQIKVHTSSCSAPWSLHSCGTEDSTQAQDYE